MYKMLAFAAAVAMGAATPAGSQETTTRTVTVNGQTMSMQIRPQTRDPGLSRQELVDAARNSVPVQPIANVPPAKPDAAR